MVKAKSDKEKLKERNITHIETKKKGQRRQKYKRVTRRTKETKHDIDHKTKLKHKTEHETKPSAK